MENGLYQRALASLDDAEQLGLDDRPLHEDRAVALRALEQVEEAARAAERLLAAEENNLIGLSVLGWAKFEGGDNAAALALYDRAITLDGSNGEYHLQRGEVLERLEREDDARVAFRRAVELSPNSAKAHLRYALALTQRGMDDEVLKEIETALQNDCRDFDVIRKFAMVLEPPHRSELWSLLDKYEAKDSASPTTAGIKN
jgi:tetratricopeptide (TPR) repeat protein